MSAESRPVPTNLLTQLTVSDLPPEHKLTLLYLWMNRFTNSAGCYELPVNMAAAEIGLKESVFSNAIEELVGRGLIDFDAITTEVFIERWYSYHSFKKPIAIQCLIRDVNKINSERLKNIISIKINSLNINTNNNKKPLIDPSIENYKALAKEKSKNRDLQIKDISKRLVKVETQVGLT